MNVRSRWTDPVSGARTVNVEVGGKEYVLYVRKLKMVRIAFQGRRKGWRWCAEIRERGSAKELWRDSHVPKDLGVKTALEWAGILNQETT